MSCSGTFSETPNIFLQHSHWLITQCCIDERKGSDKVSWGSVRFTFLRCMSLICLKIFNSDFTVYYQTLPIIMIMCITLGDPGRFSSNFISFILLLWMLFRNILKIQLSYLCRNIIILYQKWKRTAVSWFFRPDVSSLVSTPGLRWTETDSPLTSSQGHARYGPVGSRGQLHDVE